MWTDSLERGAEGEAVRADGAPPPSALYAQLLAGLPGLAPLLLNKLCTGRDHKGKDTVTQDAAADGSVDGGQVASTAVVRVHQEPPALARLRQSRRVRRNLSRRPSPAAELTPRITGRPLTPSAPRRQRGQPRLQPTWCRHRGPRPRHAAGPR